MIKKLVMFIFLTLWVCEIVWNKVKEILKGAKKKLSALFNNNKSDIMSVIAIKEFIKTHSYFDIETDDVANSLILSTREHGNVGEETPGEEDIKLGEEMCEKLVTLFPTVVDSAEMELVDEWVHVDVYLKNIKV